MLVLWKRAPAPAGHWIHECGAGGCSQLPNSAFRWPVREFSAPATLLKEDRLRGVHARAASALPCKARFLPRPSATLQCGGHRTTTCTSSLSDAFPPALRLFRKQTRCRQNRRRECRSPGRWRWRQGPPSSGNIDGSGPEDGEQPCDCLSCLLLRKTEAAALRLLHRMILTSCDRDSGCWCQKKKMRHVIA